jgi:hypothetical protein
MELHEIRVDTIASATLPWQETIIMPIGDVQLGAQGCDEDRLRRDIDWGMKHNAYFLGMGEYLDIMSPSNRQKIKAAGVYDSTEDALEEIVELKIEKFLKLVRGSEGRWLGLLEGHHLFEFKDGSTCDTRIARALKSTFLGTCAFVRVKFHRSNYSRIACTIWCHHGTGGGQKASAPLNKLENIMPYFRADIYLIGHQHKKVGTPIDQLYMTNKKPYDIKHRTKIIAGTGGYLKGYWKGARMSGVNPRGSYVERWMRPPVALGCIVLTLRPVHQKNDDRLDINVSL